jgi:hypothetical protein
MKIIDIIYKSYFAFQKNKNEITASKTARGVAIPLSLNLYVILFILISPFATLQELGGITFLVSAPLFVMGVGLLLHRRYVTNNRYTTFTFKKNTGIFIVVAIFHFIFSLIAYGIAFHAFFK